MASWQFSSRCSLCGVSVCSFDSGCHGHRHAAPAGRGWGLCIGIVRNDIRAEGAAVLLLIFFVADTFICSAFNRSVGFVCRVLYLLHKRETILFLFIFHFFQMSFAFANLGARRTPPQERCVCYCTRRCRQKPHAILPFACIGVSVCCDWVRAYCAPHRFPYSSHIARVPTLSVHDSHLSLAGVPLQMPPTAEIRKALLGAVEELSNHGLKLATKW